MLPQLASLHQTVSCTYELNPQSGLARQAPGFFHGEKPQFSEETIALPPLTPLTRAANMRLVHTVVSTQLQLSGGASFPGLVV